MARRGEQVETDEEIDADDDGDEFVMEDENDFEMDFEPGNGDGAIGIRPRRPDAWRLIEEASERRQLKRALEDFEDYVI